MSDKMGRPPLPKGKAKATQLGVRLDSATDKDISQVAEQAGESKSEWIRGAAMIESKSPPIWVTSRWSHKELEGKLVEFCLSAPKFTVNGVGEFLIRENPRGKLAIYICVRQMEGPYRTVETRYYIGQDGADRIEKHPTSKGVHFQLLA